MAAPLFADDYSYVDSGYVKSSSGKEMFRIDYYTDESDTDDGGSKAITEAEKREIEFSLRYWADLLAPGSRNTGYVPIFTYNKRKDNMGNATCGSDCSSTPAAGGGFMTVLADSLINGAASQKENGTEITVGYDWDRIQRVFPLPLEGSGSGCLLDTSIHELFHGLGLATNLAVDDTLSDERYTAFSSHLYSYWWFDSNNKMVWDTTGRKVVLNAMGEKQYGEDPTNTRGGAHLEPGVFGAAVNKSDIYTNCFFMGEGAESGVYFRGANVDDVLTVGGQMAVVQKGYDFGESETHDSPAGMLPINGWENGEDGILFDLSHIELAHSIMSHQSWRNYIAPMEAELAVLQDIGFKIDRRNHFGFSIYNSGTAEAKFSFTNANPYYARTVGSDGSFLWDGEKPNTATLGVGLHVYGGYVDVKQTASLLADGTGGAGIRNDGSHNDITLASGARVTANGKFGTGILMSYGVDNTLKIEGGASVRAAGEGGVGVRFDFGHNALGDKREYRGSYIRTVDGENWKQLGDGSYDGGYPLDLWGPMVSRFDVGGAIEGGACAVYISDNAYVGEIHLNEGASIKGGIYSAWDPESPLVMYKGGDALHTLISADADVTVDGSIVGAKSFDVSVADGKRLSVNGSIEASRLDNSGTLAVKGGTVSIRREFTNREGASLDLPLLSDGLAGLSAGSVDVKEGSGQLTVRPVRGEFYAGGTRTLGFLSGGSRVDVGGFGGYAVAGLEVFGESPTLRGLYVSDATKPSVTVEREENAYSRFASDGNSREVALALEGIAGGTGGGSGVRAALGDGGNAARPVTDGMARVLAALDWSAKDGSGIRASLPTLSPRAYNSYAMLAMRHQQAAGDILLGRMRAAWVERLCSAGGDGAWEGWESRPNDVWAQPLAGGDFQQGGGEFSAVTGGVLGGYSRWLSPVLNVGVHAGGLTAKQSVDGEFESTAKCVTALLGLSAMYEPPMARNLRVYGCTTFGFNNATLDRTVSAASETFSTTGGFSSFLSNTVAGAGYDFFAGRFAFGPDLAFGANIMRRGGSDEDGDAPALSLGGGTYVSVPATIGAHAGFVAPVGEGWRLAFEMTAGFRRVLAGGTLRTEAAFKGAEAHTFAAEDELSAKSLILLGGTARLFGDGLFSLALNVDAQFGSGRQAVCGGVNLNWKF